MRNLLLTVLLASSVVVLGYSRCATGANNWGASGGQGALELMEAVYLGDTERVRLLIRRVVDVNTKAGGPAGPYIGVSALFLAVENGHAEMAKLLLESGADINEIPEPNTLAGRASMTPLMAAAYRGDKEMVKLLIGRGANVSAEVGATAPYPQGVTALMLAEIKGHTEIVNMLKEAGTAGENLWKYMVIAVWVMLWFFILISGKKNTEQGRA